MSFVFYKRNRKILAVFLTVLMTIIPLLGGMVNATFMASAQASTMGEREILSDSTELLEKRKKQINSDEYNANLESNKSKAKEIQGIDEVIIKVKEGTNIEETLFSSNTQIIKRYKKSGIVKVKLPSGTDLQEAIKRYEADPSVEYAEPNYIYKASYIPNDPELFRQWGLTKARVTDAWDISKGSNSIIVAVIDTGVDPGHPDLSGKLVSPYNTVNDSTALEQVRDNDGHGTHVAGIAAATMNNGIGIAGVGGNVRIMPIKAGDGGFTTADVAEGIRWAADNGAKVINLSLGGYSSSTTIESAVNYALGKNVVLVAAVGNDASSSPVYPAAYNGVIAVVASNQNDYDAWFSNWGSYVDISAPGTDIYSTTPTYSVPDVARNYDYMDGTSMASPAVAGLAGLMLSMRPSLTWQQVRDYMCQNAEDINLTGDEQGWDPFTGWGRIDAYKTLNALLSDDATIVTHNIPDTMTAGQSYNISITVRNTGTTTWTKSQLYRLGAVGNSDPFATTRHELTNTDSIAPGQEKIFSFTMTAPSTPGSYLTDWRMLKEGVAWFGGTLAKNVTVSTASLTNNATIISDTIPSSMTAGQSYNVSVTVRNDGTSTWTATDNYRLGAVGNSDPFTATTRHFLGTSESIAPGQQKVFNFTLTAPSTPGNYVTDWRMLKEGVAWFGGTLVKTVTVSSPSLTNNATIISDTIPSSMTAGQSYNVSVTVRNDGTSTWTAADNYRLGAVGNSDPFTATTRHFLGGSDSIAPGQQKVFNFTLTAPSTPGSYVTDWRMLKEGVAWFGGTLVKTVTVSAASLTNNATIISDTIPSSMAAGQSYNVSVTVRNDGTSTWTAADNYRLGAVGNSDPLTTVLRHNLSGSDSIAPGQQKVFSFTLTAPSTPGSYVTDWRMLKENVAWFGGTLAKTVTVSGGTLTNNATVVADTIPSTMIAGQSYNVSVTVRNDGTSTWTAADNYKLGAVGNSDPFTTVLRHNLGGSDSIAPGQQKVFNFTLTAPSTPGSYVTDWRMLKEYVAWFGGTLAKTVTVNSSGATNNATIVSNTIPSTMTAGQSYTVSITVRNDGTSTWTRADLFRLGAVGDSDPFAAARQELSSSDSIAPGQQKIFTFTMTAPSTTGSYVTDWRMLKEGVDWFGGTLVKTVTVN